jgi:hypothetical protein
MLNAGLFVRAQTIGNPIEDETVLYAETKQVNQFIKRFNSEEDKDGNRLYEGDLGYHDNNLRTMALPMIFDNETSFISKSTQNKFIKKVTDTKNPIYLDFHGGEWFAEVIIYALYYGRSAEARLFLKIQEEEVGSKWVISQVYFEPFNAMFFKNPSGKDKFLHPMSHELDFINLEKIFRDNSLIEYYAYGDFWPDYLSIFLYEMKKKNLKFEGVKKVKLHFFQIDGYYFTLDEFNRPGYNAGWLISDLKEVSDIEKDNILNKIYHEGN